MKSSPNIRAISLLEMSITLTIISLLIAAILTGQNMKHRLELNQVITDISTITSSVKQFKDVYANNIPGDFATAASTLGSTTSDGDGNTYLATALVESPTVFDQRNTSEELFFWQHLQLAGFISGTYDGTTTGAGGLMATQMKYGFYLARKTVNFPTAAVNPTGKLLIQVSKFNGSGLFSTKEAYDFDSKYDNNDPIGLTGTITAEDGVGAVAGDCVTGGAYNTTNIGSTPCVLYFNLE